MTDVWTAQERKQFKNNPNLFPEEIQPDECPKHETPLKQEYNFGRFQNVVVCVYSGCQCAVTHDWIDGFPNPPRWHKSYNEASGTAKLKVNQAGRNWF